MSLTGTVKFPVKVYGAGVGKAVITVANITKTNFSYHGYNIRYKKLTVIQLLFLKIKIIVIIK